MNKDFFPWFHAQDVDVMCVQETKAQEHQLAGEEFRPPGYHVAFRDATTKKGYSGVAIYSRREPDELRTGLGWEPFDEEGRYIEARFGNLSVVSFYIPSGSSGEIRQGFKFEVMELRPILTSGWPAAATTCCAATGTSCARNDIRSGRQPEEFRLPAVRARVDECADRRCLR